MVTSSFLGKNMDRQEHRLSILRLGNENDSKLKCEI